MVHRDGFGIQSLLSFKKKKKLTAIQGHISSVLILAGRDAVVENQSPKYHNQQ